MSRVWICLTWIVLAVLLFCPCEMGAQPAAAPAAPEPAAEMMGPPSKLDTLRSLLTTRDGLRAELAALEKRLRAETAETAKEELRQEVEALERRRQEVERDFAAISTGIRMTGNGAKPDEGPPPTLQQEVGQLLAPILTDLRALTAKPRAIQELQEEIRALQKNREQAEQALQAVDALLEQVPQGKGAPSALRAALTETRRQWLGRRDEAVSRAGAAQHQIEELLGAQSGFWTGMGMEVRDFVFTRGTNILLALLAFLVVLYGLRALYYAALRLVPARRYQRLSFTMRVLDVAHQGGSFVLAVVTALLVLYARGDWMLGGLAIVGIGALLITAKSGFARHMEQLRLLLNLGAVREGERVVIGAVPWRVGKIHLFTQLTNSSIGGPGLRLPLDKLMELTSRSGGLDEPWFPCRKREWVLLGGSTLAQVTDITPEHVEISYGGGLRRWIPCADFLSMEAAVLSGGFARATTFGIDYEHLDKATTEIPALLREDLRAALLEHVPEAELLDVVVEFQEAAASSLNYLLAARFSGAQAQHYLILGRLLQRAAVDSCRKHGWGIPFPQMVVHSKSA